SAVQRQARGQGAGGDREGVGRGTTAGGEGLVVGAADDAIGQGGRRQHDGRRRGCLDVDRIGLAAAEPVAVGRGDGEVEGARRGGGAAGVAGGVQRHACGQGAGGDRERVRRGAATGGDRLVVARADDRVGQAGRGQHDGRWWCRRDGRAE